MRAFDHDYVEELMDRLAAIAPDARPGWGSMTPPQLLAHLTGSVRFTLGKERRVRTRDTWFLRNVVAPLVLHGVLPVPRNRTAPFADPQRGPGADLETLHAVLEEYLHAVESGDIDCPPHPYFGDIGIDGWARFHVVHFEHHLRQFGA